MKNRLFENNEQLLESIQPRPITYGSNRTMDDSQTVNLSSPTNLYYSFFKKDEKYYCILLQKAPPSYTANEDGEDEYVLGFGVSEDLSLNPMTYSHDRTNTKNVVTLFGSIIYVAGEIARQNPNIKIVSMSGDSQRFKLYEKILNNKFLRKTVEDTLGFTYTGVENGSHILRRK